MSMNELDIFKAGMRHAAALLRDMEELDGDERCYAESLELEIDQLQAMPELCEKCAGGPRDHSGA